jgi:hypothetical protein
MLKKNLIDILVKMMSNDRIGIAAACSVALSRIAKHGKQTSESFLAEAHRIC